MVGRWNLHIFMIISSCFMCFMCINGIQNWYCIKKRLKERLIYSRLTFYSYFEIIVSFLIWFVINWHGVSSQGYVEGWMRCVRCCVVCCCCMLDCFSHGQHMGGGAGAEYSITASFIRPGGWIFGTQYFLGARDSLVPRRQLEATSCSSRKFGETLRGYYRGPITGKYSRPLPVG